MKKLLLITLVFAVLGSVTLFAAPKGCPKGQKICGEGCIPTNQACNDAAKAKEAKEAKEKAEREKKAEEEKQAKIKKLDAEHLKKTGCNLGKKKCGKECVPEAMKCTK